MIKFIVNTFNKNIFEKIQNFPIILRISDIKNISTINYESNIKNVAKVLITLDSDSPILKIENDKIPVDVYLRKITSLIKQLPSNITVFLHSDLDENYLKVQKLAESGIRCGIFLNKTDEVNWDRLSKLFNYCQYNNNLMHLIEPFNSLINYYCKPLLYNVNSIYCNNPDEYLHINDNGDIAISLEDMYNSHFTVNINSTPFLVDKILEQNRIKDNSFFLTRHRCSNCIGWGMCKGIFSGRNATENCRLFFKEITGYLNDQIERLAKSKVTNENNNI